MILYLGGATCLTAVQTIFSNVIGKEIRKNIPSANAELIVHSGARSICQLVTAEQLPGVLQAYTTAITNIMYLGSAMSVMALIFSTGLGWKDIRVAHKKANQAKSEEAAPKQMN
ncbi:hypothetical protein N7475_009144 [Penicillium sp. IBT 31633x]|nr:hypothetical protein N7475_009144 [Penicillium sp. IBT 31633x]